MAFTISVSDLPQVKEAKGPYVKTPENVKDVLGDIASLAQEVFAVITLNVKNKLIDKHIVSIGLIDAALVSPQIVFKHAILDNASSIIVAHNHPSGETTPSVADIKLTKNLVLAGQHLDLPVLDHVIVTGNNSFSMRENGMVDFS